MCEQTPMAYKQGDIVWVKLGPCWWPGEVVSFDELPSDVIESFKKPPLAVVKFFNEENYEFVRNLNNIYLYNSHKKYEFIKKGLDLHRAKHSFMEKFPSDVCAAEEKTDGNPNILNDPQLTPEKRTDYTDIFGLSSPKRGTKESPRFRSKHSFSRHSSSGGSPKKRSSLITHPRFLSKGKDDHEVRILIQVSEEAKPPQQEYTCHTCGFKSTRVDVIVLHNKSHITGVYTPVSISKKSKQQASPRRAKKVKKSPSPPKKPTTTTATAQEEEQRPVLTDFKSDLLAEWNDDEDEEEEEEEQSTNESSIINEPFSKKHHLEDELDDAKRKKAMKMSHSKTRTLEEDLALVEKGIPLCTESSSENESEDSLPKAKRKSPPSIIEETSSSESGAKKEQPKTLQSFLDFEKEIAKDNLIMYSSEKLRKQPSVVSDDSDYAPLKNKRKHVKTPVSKAKKSKVSVTVKAKSDFTSDLLAEWDDDDDEDEDEADLTENEDKSEQALGVLKKQNEEAASKNEVVNKEPPDGVGTGTGKKEKSSCFDFDEDEDTELLARSEEGRKIPRVIPPPASSNNKMPLDIELSDENLLDSIDEGMSSEKPEETDVTVDDDDDKSSKTAERLPTPEAADVCNKVDDFNEETEAFNSILASTVVPKLPEIPRLLKCEQNFHSASTIKFPDKNANEDFDCDVPTPEGTVITTIVEPNDKQEDIIEVVEESADAEEPKEETVEVAQKEPEAELPVEVVDNSANINKEAEDEEEEEEDEASKTETSSIDETPINKDSESSKDVDDTISEDSAPHPLGSPLTPPPARSCSPSPKLEVSFDFQKTIQAEAPKQTEVATKLTNPKKRFVKTFEDETKNLSEKSSQEEQVPDEMKNVKVSKLKTLLMSKININSYRKKGFDYERITLHKSRGSRSKLDDLLLGSEKAVESHPPVLEELLGERSLDLTAKEEARVLVSCPQEKIEETIPSPPPTKEGDDTIAEEEITEFVGDDNKLQEVASAEDKNDSKEEDKMEAENDVDLQENKKQEDALLESMAASSDSELKIVEEQIQVEDTIVEENRPEEEKAESVLPSTSEVMIQEGEALPEEPVDLNNPPTDEKAALNNLVNDDSVSEMEDPKPPIIESGNLTIVHEEDLVDKQVEITNQAEQKPVTLSNFSMDYCEDNTSDNHRHQNVTIVEKVVPEEKVKQSNKVQVDYGFVQDVEEKISSFEINKQFKPEKVVSEEEDVEDEEGAVVENEGVKKEEKVLDPPFVEKETSLETEMAKITDASNDSSVLVEHVEESTSSTKLLEILTDVTPKPEKVKPSIPPPSVLISSKSITKDKMKILNRIETKSAKFIGKSAIAGTSKIGGSAKVITEKVIKPVESETLVSVKKVSSKRSYQDVEDIDAFIIQKPLKKLAVASDSNLQESVQIAPTPKGKARILQQTIITPAGDIIQPIVSSQSQNDDNNMFDINSMPIVLDDQILTPESIENMPIVLQESPPPPPPPPTIPTPAKSNPVKKISSQQVKLLNKTIAAAPPKETTMVKTQPSLIKQYSKPTRVHKVYQTGSSKLLKHNPAVITQTGKPGKFIIVPSTAAPTGNKYTVGKRPPIIKRSTSSVNVSTPSITKVQNIAPEPTGNKIMIVTNNLGQQQRVLLTPVQQKMLAYPSPSSKLKPVVKNSGGIQHKAIAIKESSPAATKLAGSKTPSQVFSSITTTQQLKSVKVDPSKMKKVPLQNQKLYLPVNKPSTSGRTIIIKNPQGQTVKRIQSSDDSLMEQQVAEQIQAINRASTKPLLKELPITKTRTPVKKSYAKKPIGDSSRILSQSKSHVPTLVATSSSSSMNKTSSLPPLAPISMQKKLDVVSVSHSSQSQAVSEVSETTQPVQVSEDKSEETKRLPHQLVIQDAHGNQTTITEGQILALPSEAIDGQPQSYVLVTLDETGNLAPLNNEALMSLDPNLSLGGDLGNMVLQIDQGASSESEPASEVIPPPPPPSNQEVAATNPVNVLPKTVEPPQEPLAESAAQDSNLDSNSLQAVAINSGDTGQQLIITGDPISTQKFLESLTDGNADLANLLANTKGNILIQAEGQQILINTDTENQMLLTVNPENLGNVENTEGNGNPIFATQPMKNQDILAAALADTDVFQQDQSISHSPSKVIQSQLSPNSTLYPIHAGNVLETSSMSSPIMTPLEVPSTNNKKIDDEADILSQVPKNVDLPITITDPNISQTVAQQQVVSLMAAELPSTLDLPPLTIQDPSMSVTSSEMNSPSFVYSLPVLDDAVDMNQKAFSTSISMPLLTEDPEDALVVEATADADSKIAAEAAELSLKETETGNKSPKEMELSAIRDDKTDLKDNFMDAEGLCTMRGGICNSLSEPPPDMFDFSVGTQNYESSSEVKSNSTDIDNIPTESPSTTPITTRQDEEDSGSDKSKLDVDSDLKLEESKPMDVMYSVGSNLEMRSHTPSTNTDDSCEIPVQPEIVTDLTLKNFHNDSGMTDSNFESNGSSLNDESDI